MAKYKITVSWIVDAPDKPEAISKAAKKIGEEVEYVSAKKIDSGIVREVFSQLTGA